MNTGDNIRALGKTLSQISKRHVKVQTAFVTVKSVDWSKKTMVATGVVDDLEYYDVLLGLGNVYRKPAVDSVCLIGMIENQDAAFFLIDAEVVEEIAIKADVKIQIDCDDIEFNGGSNNGLVVLQKLQANLDTLKDYIKNTLEPAIGNGLTAVGVGTAANGGTGKTEFDAATSAQQISFEDMENSKVKH